MLFKIVRMEFDETRHQIITFKINCRAMPGMVPVYSGDNAVPNRQGTFNNLIGKDEPGIGKNLLSHHLQP